MDIEYEQSVATLPTTSDVGLFRDLKRVVDLDTEVANSTFNFGVAQQKLHRSQISSAAVDQCRFCSAHRMRAKGERVKSDSGNPFTNESGVLACC